MIGRMAVKVARPIGSMLFAAEPFIGRFSQRGQNILMNLHVPGQDFLGGRSCQRM